MERAETICPRCDKAWLIHDCPDALGADVRSSVLDIMNERQRQEWARAEQAEAERDAALWFLAEREWRFVEGRDSTIYDWRVVLFDATTALSEAQARVSELRAKNDALAHDLNDLNRLSNEERDAAQARLEELERTAQDVHGAAKMVYDLYASGFPKSKSFHDLNPALENLRRVLEQGQTQTAQSG